MQGLRTAFPPWAPQGAPALVPLQFRPGFAFVQPGQSAMLHAMHLLLREIPALVLWQPSCPSGQPCGMS